MVLGILILIVIGGVVLVLRQQSSEKPSTVIVNPEVAKASQTSGLTKSFSAMKGETYDRAFIEEMLVNQKNTATFATIAETNAKHTELKAFAQRTVTAANARIADLTAWQKQWNYQAPVDPNEDHTSEELVNENEGDANQLKGQSGDAFDKLYISRVTGLYQEALDIAAPGRQNAAHPEIKKLASTITADQAKDLAQLRQWQKAWGY
jgi:uncharacterized protein (DUF305 family)